MCKKPKCQCNTNDRETTSAIDSGKQLDMDVTSKIEDKTAASAKLSTEAKNLQSDIDSRRQQLDEATTLRKKQIASFTQEEKELLEANLSLSLFRSRRRLSAMEGSLWNPSSSAITVLKKHHTDFVQMIHVAKGRMLQGVRTEAKKQAVLWLA